MKKSLPKFLKQSLSVLIIPLSIISLVTIFSWKSEAVEDKVPPVLHAFSISPQSINTEDGPVIVTLTVTVTDDVAMGESAGTVQFKPDSGAEQTINFNLGHVSGNIYSATATFPQYSAKGLWNILGEYELSDAVWNYASYSKSAIETISGVGSATINNTATIEDVTAPVLQSFSFLTKEINTEEDDVLVEFTASATDDRSGLKDLELNMMSLNPATENKVIRCNMTEDDLIEGNYSCEINFPWGSAKGWWKVDWVRLADQRGNYFYYENDDIVEEFGVLESKLFNAATIDDLLPPVLTGVSVTPSVFDTSKGEVEVVMDLRITDNMTGVVRDSINVGTNSIAGGLGGQWFSDFQLIEGDEINGLYRASTVFPQDAKAGIWPIEGVMAQDRALNDGCVLGENVNQDDMTLINSANSDSVTIEGEGDWVIQNEKVAIRFYSGTVITKTDGGSFAFYRMLSQFYDVKEIGGLSQALNVINGVQAESNVSAGDALSKVFACNEGEDCVATVMSETGFQGDPVAILRAGIPGINMHFSKPVEIEIKEMFDYEGQELVIQTFHEGGSVWEEETTCLVEEVEYFRFGEKGGGLLPSGEWLDPENPPRAVSCIFTVDHASFFGASVLGAEEVAVVTLPATGAGIYKLILPALFMIVAYVGLSYYKTKKESIGNGL